MLLLPKTLLILQKIFKNLTRSRKERQEEYGVTALRALRLCVKIKFVCSLVPRYELFVIFMISSASFQFSKLSNISFLFIDNLLIDMRLPDF